MTQWYLLGCVLFKILNSYANKDQSMRISKSYLIRASSTKWVSHHHFYLAETRRQPEEWESFLMQKEKDFR